MRASFQYNRRRQFDLFSQALRWAKGDNVEQCKRSIKRAMEYSPITEMQWWHLKIILGNETIQNIQATVGVGREFQNVRG